MNISFQRFFPSYTEYYLVQFVDDGIVYIVTENRLKTTDGQKEAHYGDTHYLYIQLSSTVVSLKYICYKKLSCLENCLERFPHRPQH